MRGGYGACLGRWFFDTAPTCSGAVSPSPPSSPTRWRHCLSAGDVSGLVLAARPGRATEAAKLTASGLQSVLNFLPVDGLVPSPLVDAVPAVAAWRMAAARSC